MNVYEKGRALAERLIKKFDGKPSTIYTPEEADGVNGVGMPTTGKPRYDIEGLATAALDYKKEEIDGALIKATDCYIFFHSTELPKIGMYHDVNGVTYRVQDLKIIQSRDGVVSLCQVQLRTS